MHLTTTAVVAAAAALLAGELPALAVPVQDSPRQRLLDGKGLPASFATGARKPNNPYTPGFRDPLDRAVDSVGAGLDPLPYRNGLGGSVLGPWNPERARQNPDLVRPPSTDHGDVPNLRWSFVDSHIRIEVAGPLSFSPTERRSMDRRPR